MNSQNCRSCDSPLRENAKFCPKCGTSVFERTPEIKPILGANTESTDLTGWPTFKLALQYYAAFLAISFAHSMVFKFTDNPIVEVSTWFAMTAVTIHYCSFDILSFKQWFKLKAPSAVTILTILCVAIACYVLINAYFSMFEILKRESNKYTANIIKYSWPMWTAYFLTAVCPGILEEIGFRGFIYQKLREIFTVKEALFIQAACFSVLHLMPTIFISHLMMGLFLGWVREKTGSLYLSIIFHISWNAHIVFLELNK